MAAQVQILLSTWNGENWLQELLDSLLQQTTDEWELLIRDDGSQDQTCKLLLEWQQQYPDKVARLEIDGQHMGFARSFSRLVEVSDAPYLMFCDQDDVWFPDKVATELRCIQQLSTQHDVDCPLLVHSDLALVNSNKTLMAASFWQLRGFDVHQQKQEYLLTNTVTGCAVLFNRAAAEKAFPMPAGVKYHDRWLALVCAWFGQVHPVDKPLLFYRQHANNHTGAGLGNYGHVSGDSIPQRVEAWSRQAGIFLQRFGAELSTPDYCLIEALAELRHLRGWERRKHIVQHRLFKQGVLANLALLWFA
ncbi:MAG: glycosyltransferase family 2 protein [Thiolinea sp.]